MSRALFRQQHVRIPGVLHGKDTPYKGLFADHQQERKYLWENRFLHLLPFLKAGYIDSLLKNRKQEEVAHIKEYFKRILRGAAEAILKDTDKSAIRYGSKDHMDLQQLFDVFPEARVISIERDGRDVVVSKRFHTLRTGTRLHGDEKYLFHAWWNAIVPLRIILAALNLKWGLFGPRWFKDSTKSENIIHRDVILKYAGEWKKTVSYIRHFRDLYPGKVHIVQYEKLLSEPAKEVAAICRFLEISSETGVVQQIIDANAFDKKQKKGETSFYRKGGSGDWKQYFNAQDKALFKQVTGNLLVEMGYETSMDW